MHVHHAGNAVHAMCSWFSFVFKELAAQRRGNTPKASEPQLLCCLLILLLSLCCYGLRRFPDPQQPPATALPNVVWRRVGGALYLPSGKMPKLLQGAMQNHSFLGALATVACKQDMLLDLIVSDEQAVHGLYTLQVRAVRQQYMWRCIGGWGWKGVCGKWVCRSFHACVWHALLAACCCWIQQHALLAVCYGHWQFSTMHGKCIGAQAKRTHQHLSCAPVTCIPSRRVMLNLSLQYATTQRTLNTTDMCCAQFYKHGCWQRVVVDNFLPCVEGEDRLAFACSGHVGELWPSFLEKGYAKV